jgi:hypothetical protein
MGAKLNIPLPSNGLVVDRPAEYIDYRSAFNIKNMETNRGIIRKRFGTVQLGASLGERIMRYFELQVGGTTRLFRVGLTKVEILNKSTGTWGSVTGYPLSGTQNDIVNFAFPLLSGTKIVVYTNGINAIRKCSITGLDSNLGGSPPKARFVQAFGPYLVLAYIISDGNTYYSRVQWCDTGNPESWSPTGTNAGSQDLLDDPEDITGMSLMGSYLTIHKSASIYLGQLVSTSDVFRFDRRATGIGTVAGATIQQLPSGQQIFLGSEGLHIFDGNSAPLVDAPIQDELRERLNPLFAYKSHAISVRELDEYWVAVPLDDDEEPTTVYKYNWRTGQMYKDFRSNLSAMGLYLNSQGNYVWDSMTGAWNSATLRWANELSSALNPWIAFGDISGLSSNRTEATHDDIGIANDAIWETKDFVGEDFGISDIDVMMRWKGGQVWAKGDSVNIYYSTDSGANWVSVTTLTLSDDYPEDDSPIMFYFDVVSSKIRFRFTNSVTEESFTIKKYQIEALRREIRK